MKTCCCCCSLRTGSVFSGVWGLLFASLALAAYIFFVITLEIAQGSLGTGQADTASVLNTIYAFQNRYTVYVGLAVSFLWFISCIVLFAGICVKNRWCLVPWLVFTVLATLGLIAVLVLVLVNGVVLLYVFWLFWVIVGVLFLIIVFDIYALVCVGFYFRELSREREVEENRAMRMVQYNGNHDQGGKPAYAYAAGGYPQYPQQRQNDYISQKQGHAVFSPYGTEFDDHGSYKKPPTGGHVNQGYQYRPSYNGGGYEYDYNKRY